MREWQKTKARPYDGRGGGRSRSFGEDKRSFSSSFREAPVKVGDQYDVDIIDVGKQGDGIAKVEGFIIFIKGVKKDDKVKIAITEIRGKSAIGEVVKPVEEGEGITEEGLSKDVDEGEEDEEEGEAT